MSREYFWDPAIEGGVSDVLGRNIFSFVFGRTFLLPPTCHPGRAVLFVVPSPPGRTVHPCPMCQAGVLSKTVSPYRSGFHANFRAGLGEHIIMPAINDEGDINIGAETAGDLIRGARTSLCRMDVTDPEVQQGPNQYTSACVRRCAFCASLSRSRGVESDTNCRRAYDSLSSVTSVVDAWPPPTEIGAPPLHVFIVNLMKDVVLHVARCKLYPHGLFLFCHLT